MQDMPRPVNHNAWRNDADELKQVLRDAQKERSIRSEVLPISGELGWIRFERLQMLDAVNRLRARYGKGPINPESLTMAEMRATGHSDYTAKFAYGAADLVHAE